MRAREFIGEATKGKLAQDRSAAMPATYTIPDLPNQDPYLQYRFGVAIASAKGRAQREKDGVKHMDRESVFGENEVVVSYAQDVGPWIDDALSTMGLKNKKLISTPGSDEPQDTGITSPIKGFKGY